MNEARMICAQQPLHLVFCEGGLPGGVFREVLRNPKSTGSGVPLVVCSLLGELDEYLEAMQLGRFDLIAHPYRRNDA
jgi:DNA-binding NtrC family response regulator